MEKGLFLSGGATKFIGLVGAATALKDSGYRPTILAGISSGAILSILIACNKLPQAREIGLSMTLDTIFSSSPFTKKGKITGRAVSRVIAGLLFPFKWNYLGKMGNLEKLLRQVITKEVFYEYQNNNKTPPVYVIAVNPKDSSRKHWNLKDCGYELSIKAIMASSSIAGVAPAVKIDGEYYYDGGHRDHSPGAYMLTYSGLEFSEVVSVYTRSKNYDRTDDNLWNKNIIKLFLDFVIPTFNIEISKNDELTELNRTKERGIELAQVFIEPFSKWLFDTHPRTLNQGYLNGVESIRKYYPKSRNGNLNSNFK